ncbi:MAG: GlsB/YeaQ/YmgE family stress response membrane protein [Bacteroidales bacterium]
MFYLIGWIVFGLIVGVIAKLLMPGRDPGGFVVTILLGIVGALLGGWIGRAAGWYRPGEGAGYLMSIAGAIIVLFIYRLVVGRSRYTT